MSWVERMIEERLANAAAAGELDVPHLHGKPLRDLDRQREQGWWADQFVRRERSHDRRRVAEAAAADARARFWRAATQDELRELVRTANAAIVTANINLVDDDRLATFDWPDTLARWQQLQT